MEIDVRQIARRAAGRALADRGLEVGPSRPRGVAVRLPSPPPTPANAPGSPASPAAQRGRELITAECLAHTVEGETFVIPDGALVTALAREEAKRRGVRLREARDARQQTISVGADHGGFELKADVLAWVRELGHKAVDLGTRDTTAVDYPDFAQAVAEAVASGQSDLGIVIDGAGIGSAIAANKVPGVRAATCVDAAMASNAREHNYANVLSLGAKLERSQVFEIVRTFLTTPVGAARHGRRVDKITAIERRYSGAPSSPGVRA